MWYGGLGTLLNVKLFLFNNTEFMLLNIPCIINFSLGWVKSCIIVVIIPLACDRLLCLKISVCDGVAGEISM